MSSRALGETRFDVNRESGRGREGGEGAATGPHPAEKAVGLAVSARDAGPVNTNLVARELEVHFPFPGRSKGPRPIRLVHHCDGPTSTSNRLGPIPQPKLNGK